MEDAQLESVKAYMGIGSKGPKEARNRDRQKMLGKDIILIRKLICSEKKRFVFFHLFIPTHEP